MRPLPKEFVQLTLLSCASLGMALPAIAQKPPQEQVAQMEKITRDISAGENISFDHSVEIIGSIGPRARVLVNSGGIRIEGDVGDHATIEARGGGGGAVVTIHESNVSTNSYTSIVVNNGEVTVNGKRINTGTAEKDIAGIEIKGAVSRHATLQTNASIVVGGDVEASSRLKADGSINIGGKVAEGATLASGGSITAQNIGDDTQADAGGSIQGLNVGKHATLVAGGSIRVRDVSAGAKLDAGGSVVADKIISGAKIDAGGSITAESARLEDLSAGGAVHIQE